MKNILFSLQIFGLIIMLPLGQISEMHDAAGKFFKNTTHSKITKKIEQTGRSLSGNDTLQDQDVLSTIHIIGLGMAE